jgi:CheY-like chemotaxis protein
LGCQGCLSVAEAQGLIQTQCFDVALIDLLLPPDYAREGLELLRAINRRYHSETIALMMTPKDSRITEIAADAMRLGAHYFLDKTSPVFEEKLMTMIDEAVAYKRRRVFLSHGHNELLLLRLKNFLATSLKLDTVVLKELPSRGLTVVEKLERASEKCSFAVILLTRDDEQHDGALRARQNVIHELGFCQGKYGRQNVVLLAERGVELFTNISGIVRVEFDPQHFDSSFEELRREMQSAFPGEPVL